MKLEAQNLSFRYESHRPWILRDLNLSLSPGERVGLVGPSGCGKSTLAALLSGYRTPISGDVRLAGAPLPKHGFCPVQLIHQTPEQAINPRWQLKQTLAEAGITDGGLTRQLGIEAAWLSRYPRELSGGELQRFCVARALAEGTRFLLADEISTMLDVITQAQIWEVVLTAVKERGLGLLVVTHNKALAERVCDRILDFQQLNSPTRDLSVSPQVDQAV